MNNGDFFSGISRGLGVVLINSLFGISPATALNVTSGVFIQTVDEPALLDSANLRVKDFFNAKDSSRLLVNDIVTGGPSISGAASVAANRYVYDINETDLVIENRSTWPTNFTYNPDDVVGTASGSIGLGGVMTFALPSPDENFVFGDWIVEYDPGRIADGGSGWFMTNLFQFAAAGVDILNETIFTNSDSLFLSGDMTWSPDFTSGFSGVVPASETYRKFSDFVMCAQDDEALSSNPVQQIPCVFTNISLNGATLAVDLALATKEPYLNADYFVAFVYNNESYWLNQNFEWVKTAGPAYQGALIDVRSFVLPNITIDIPSGTTIPVYFGVDVNQNGTVDQPYRLSSVTMTIN